MGILISNRSRATSFLNAIARLLYFPSIIFTGKSQNAPTYRW